MRTYFDMLLLRLTFRMLFIVPVLYTPLKKIYSYTGDVVHLYVVVNYVDFTPVNITFVYTKYLIEANVSRNMDMKYRVYIKTTTIEMDIIFNCSKC